MAIDDLSDDDLGLLFDEDLSDDEDEKKPQKKKRSPIIPIVATLLIGSFAAFAVFNNQSEEAPPPKPEKPRNVALQLVNLQQVAWADNMCTTVDSWSDYTVTMETPENPVFILKARNNMVDNLRENANVIKENAEELSALPESSFTQAKTQESEALVTDNYKKVGEGTDPKIDSANRAIYSSLQGYASALEEVADNMDRVADYNFDGMRGSIDDAKKSLESMKEQLGKDVTAAFGDDFFDNTITMLKVSELETCNGSVINNEELMKERGKEIEEQKIISDFVVLERCQQYVDNTKLITDPDESTQANIDDCQDFLATTTVDKNNPLLKGEVDSMDSSRVRPERSTEQAPGDGDAEGEQQGDDSGYNSTNSEENAPSSENNSDGEGSPAPQPSSTSETADNKDNAPSDGEKQP